MSAHHHYFGHNHHPPHAHQHSTLFPSADESALEEDEFDDPVGRTVNIIGLLVALLVSVIIIVGVAFVIRKIRKRQGPVDDDPEDASTTAAGERKGEADAQQPGTVAIHPANADEETPQIFTITFTEVPKKQNMYMRALPKFLRPKPKEVDIEKIKRELSHVYVY